MIIAAAAMLSGFACRSVGEAAAPPQFITIDGTDLVSPDGGKFFIRGTNLGNWLNPEGYMFGFKRAGSAHLIDQMFRQLAGPEFTNEFWRRFKDNYITEEDIRFIASTGANTIRLPFHYKLFTDEDYMGLTSSQDGFARIDSVIRWSRDAGVYVILDMHDAPGGQTGDNIDDSYGYPWLFECEASQQLFCDIWRRIAERYADEPVVLGYDLINEPIAPYFDNMEEINLRLEPLYKRVTAVIREVDTNHIIMLGGPQWNSRFHVFEDWKFDDKIMYTCHRYGGDPIPESITGFTEFRDRTGIPMYMGEIGHNTYEWMSDFCRTMEGCNIGYTFWPYKKINNSSFAGIVPPDNWDVVVAFAESPRGTYNEIREARPDQAVARKAMEDFLESVKFANNTIDKQYVEALGLAVPE